MIAENRTSSPGWPEISVGLVAYALLLLCFALLLGLLPANDTVLLGVVGSTAGGFVGVGAFLVAFGLRIRTLRAFGFTSVRPRWLIAAVALGIVGYGLNLVIQMTYMIWFGSDDPPRGGAGWCDSVSVVFPRGCAVHAFR